MAKTNVYIVYDVVADETIIIGSAKTDGLFVRQNVPYLSKINPQYLSDMQIYCVGEYVDSDKCIIPCEVRSVSWDSYKFPEQSEPVTLVNRPTVVNSRPAE